MICSRFRCRGNWLPDASMKVTESYTIDFSGQWNGFFVGIPQGDTPIKDVVVSENGQAYEFNPGEDYGPPGTYLVKEEGDNLLIDWSTMRLMKPGLLQSPTK